MSDLYLMSPPSPAWALSGRANFRSRDAAPVDAAKARREWLALAEAIERFGATVAVLESDDPTLTGLPYAAEAGHVLPPSAGGSGKHRFLLPRMKAPHRQRERGVWRPFAEAAGFEVIDPGAGLWEAQGDVAVFDGVTLLFFGGRTDREGMEAARRFFDGELLVLEIREPAFHGNMALLPLAAADRLLVCPEVFVGDGVERLQARFGRDRIERVTEAEIRSYATNGLPVGDRWLAPSVVPERVRRLVEGFGMHVELFEMSELCEKAGGASRCLVCHAPGAAAAVRIADEHRLPAVAGRIRGEAASSEGAADA
jgi:N-dimethylarginine dimethylaminohydrolase